jgi:hypothetical protein
VQDFGCTSGETQHAPAALTCIPHMDVFGALELKSNLLQHLRPLFTTPLVCMISLLLEAACELLQH